MTDGDLTDEERERLGDVVALQPTKNSELADRWGLEGGSEVHSYLENHLKDYYFRDENSLIRATEEAAEISGVDPGISENDDGSRVVRVPDLQYHVLRVLADEDEEPQSVVGVLQAVRALDEGLDPDNDGIREALRSLANKGVVEKVQLTVPTYRLAMSRDDLQVERLDD
ncbi:DUF5797 family protein [Haloglomus halophilum]|uniref:DUF5797 family protein n=1 Tax=Haloglomus halophilum TaxID=2962672 RepID=UPI0020C96DCA|nr:DUF5797 family protein [Haloglomus halophilum]